MMKSPLDQIEQRIKALFEHGSVDLPWMNNGSAFLHALTEAIHSSLATGDFSVQAPPDIFMIYLSPQDAAMIESQSTWQEAFYPLINKIALEHNLRLEKDPSIRLVVKNSLLPTQVKVVANTRNPITGQTSAVPIKVEKAADEPARSSMQGCLILEDDTNFYLDMPVVNIGRKSNNHLVINDLRVSRTHAQIRAAETGYMIFDTGSSGGTYINGERITRRLLKPGDVISLAGVKLIFIQEQSHLPAEEERQITSEMNANSKGNAC